MKFVEKFITRLSKERAYLICITHGAEIDLNYFGVKAENPSLTAIEYEYIKKSKEKKKNRFGKKIKLVIQIKDIYQRLKPIGLAATTGNLIIATGLSFVNKTEKEKFNNLENNDEVNMILTVISGKYLIDLKMLAKRFQGKTQTMNINHQNNITAINQENSKRQDELTRMYEVILEQYRNKLYQSVSEQTKDLIGSEDRFINTILDAVDVLKADSGTNEKNKKLAELMKMKEIEENSIVNSEQEKLNEINEDDYDYGIDDDDEIEPNNE